MYRIHLKKPLGGAALVLTLAVGGAFIRLPAHEQQNTAAAAQIVPAPVAVVESRDIIPWMEFSGRLEAVERVELRSRVSGQVQTVHFHEGGLVKKGELLVTIDPAPFAAEVAGAQARVAQAQARLTLTRGDHDRARRLSGSGFIAKRDLDTRANASAEAEASLKAAQAALETARLNLDYTQIRAPISGRIGRAEITSGNLVAAGPNAPVLATLVSVNPIYAAFDADEDAVAATLSDLPPGSDVARAVERIPVTMSAPNVRFETFPGHVNMIDNTVNLRSGTVRVRAVFDNPTGALTPGQFARLRMGRSKPTQAILVSEKAIGTDQDKKFVLLVGENNKVAYREVALGASVGGARIIAAGLKPGERIVVGGLQRLQPGMVIAPQLATLAPAATAEGDDR